MDNLKDQLIRSVASPIAKDKESLTTVAYVVNSSKKTNTCTIRYTDANGTKKETPDVEIDLRNHTFWFPKQGDFVIYESNGDNGVVTSKYTENFIQDVRSTRSVKTDRTADGDSSLVGGDII